MLGINVLKDLFAGVRDFIGGCSGIYQKELQRIRDIALEELQERVQELSANAVIGIDINYKVVGKENGMLMFSTSGIVVSMESK